jgi:hypothetical protein
MEQLRAEIEELKRRGSAEPFSKGKRKTNPQPPGRKPGQGPFRFRAAPERTAGETIPVAVATDDCPCCGGPLGESRPEIVSMTDIPAAPQPEIRRYEVGVRKCSQLPRVSRSGGLDGVIYSLLLAQHAIEMFRRSLPNGVPKHRLDQLVGFLRRAEKPTEN